jgi:hypothetical protein
VTLHYDRDVMTQGPWRPVWQPLEWPGAFDGSESPHPDWACPGRLPGLVFNNEPIGPRSSVADDGDPRRIALAYVTTFLGGNAAYVFHAGPGVRGGGREDLARGRAADFSGMTDADAILGALAAMRRTMPAGLANWTRLTDAAIREQFGGLGTALDRGDAARVAVSTNGPEWVGVVLGLRRDIVLRPAAAGTIEILDPLTGHVLSSRTVAAGEAVRLVLADSGGGLVLRGRRAGP